MSRNFNVSGTTGESNVHGTNSKSFSIKKKTNVRLVNKNVDTSINTNQGCPPECKKCTEIKAKMKEFMYEMKIKEFQVNQIQGL